MKQRKSSRTGASNLKKIYDEVAKFCEEKQDINSDRKNDELLKKSFQVYIFELGFILFFYQKFIKKYRWKLSQPMLWVSLYLGIYTLASKYRLGSIEDSLNFKK